MSGVRTVPAPPGFLGCAKCRQVKPESEFTWQKRGIQRNSYCKPCKKADRAAYMADRQSRPDTDAPLRFWPKVEKTEGCWNWIGGKVKGGYGLFLYQGRQIQAHRMSLILAGVELPPPYPASLMVVDHICKNPGCVRPEHLRIVEQSRNVMELANSTPFYRNKLKTHCKHGHEFTEANTYRNPAAPKGRQCRACIVRRMGEFRNPESSR